MFGRKFWFSPFMLFSLSMVAKMYLAWFVIFDDAFSWTPLMTGIPSVWVVFCLIERFAAKRKLTYYMVANLLMTSIFFAAIMYYKYYGVIVTHHALQQAGQVTQVKGSVLYLMHAYFLLIYTDIALLAPLFLFKKKTRNWRSPAQLRTVAPALGILSLAACILLVGSHRDSINEIKQAEQMGVLNYEIYALFADRKPQLIEAEGITPKSVLQAKGIQENTGPKAYFQAAQGRNVIVLQLESLQNFLVGLKIDGQEMTPNLNRLAEQHLYFPRFYQQVGQGNTSDAEFVVNTSFYVPPYGAAAQEYADRALPSLPRLFRDRGYEAVTFHTNDVEFWNRGQLYSALGFSTYYDSRFFGETDRIEFGASDEVLYAKTAEEMARIQGSGKPFYANVISMSAHHPFNLPEDKRRIRLPERYEGTFVGNYIISQNYADYALGQFFDKLKASGLWDKSLLVVYGDHMGLPMYSLNDNDKALLHEIYGREYGYPEMINIPLILAAPGVTKPAVLSHTVGGQTDLLPTIANLTGLSSDGSPRFGQDLLNPQPTLLPEHYYLPSGSFINDRAVFVPGDGYPDGTVYPLSDLGGSSVQVSQDEYERALQLFLMSESYVRQLPKH